MNFKPVRHARVTSSSEQGGKVHILETIALPNEIVSHPCLLRLKPITCSFVLYIFYTAIIKITCTCACFITYQVNP